MRTITARGSGEALPNGATLDAYLTTLLGDLKRSGIDAQVTPVPNPPYPALDIPHLISDIVHNRVDNGAWVQGAVSGAQWVDHAIVQSVATCGAATRIILAGYSQGAWLIHAALWALPSQDLPYVTSVDLFGDPAFQFGPSWAHLYNPPLIPVTVFGVGFNNGSDAHLGSPLPMRAKGIPAAVAARTSSYCLLHDPVCQDNTIFAAQEFAQCFAGHCAHFDYPKSLTTVGAYLTAARLRGLIFITTATLPAAFPGQPYSVTLRAVGGTPPYTWSIAPVGGGELPPGITLAPDGTISGALSATPVQTYDDHLVFTVTDAHHNTVSRPLILTELP